MFFSVLPDSVSLLIYKMMKSWFSNFKQFYYFNTLIIKPYVQGGMTDDQCKMMKRSLQSSHKQVSFIIIKISFVYKYINCCGEGGGKTIIIMSQLIELEESKYRQCHDLGNAIKVARGERRPANNKRTCRIE